MTENNIKNEEGPKPSKAIASRDYYAAKYKNIIDLPGVGEATANALRTSGFRTVQSIAMVTVRDLNKACQGIGEVTASKAIEAARKTLAIRFVTGKEFAELRSHMTQMTTGCTTLDALFSGGLETMSLTEFHGEFGSGKSQLCHQVAVSVQLPVDKGGLGGAALYIDTEQVFRPERCVQIATAYNMDPDEVLENIIYAEAYNSQHQTELIENADEIIKEMNIRCIIVDSLTGTFRAEYLGRENLAPRQQALNKHMHKILRMARAFNAVAVVTNQVSATPDAAYGVQPPTPIGGNIVAHASHTMVYLRKGRDNLRIAKVTASPFLPSGIEAPFRITETGLVGASA